MLIAPAECNLQGRMELGQRRLFGDKKAPSHRRRYAAQSGAEVHRTHFVLRVHPATLTPISAQLKPRSSTRNGPLSKLHQVLERNREAGRPVPSDEILAH